MSKEASLQHRIGVQVLYNSISQDTQVPNLKDRHQKMHWRPRFLTLLFTSYLDDFAAQIFVFCNSFPARMRLYLKCILAQFLLSFFKNYLIHLVVWIQNHFEENFIGLYFFIKFNKISKEHTFDFIRWICKVVKESTKYCFKFTYGTRKN